jgi:hypothetical protein
MSVASILILAVLFFAVRSHEFRMLLLIMASLGLGGLWFLMDFGADKPQTIFYRSSAHPAFLMMPESVCPADRHVWNGWCVK